MSPSGNCGNFLLEGHTVSTLSGAAGVGEGEGGRGRACTGSSKARAFLAGKPLPDGLTGGLPCVPLIILLSEDLGFGIGLDLFLDFSLDFCLVILFASMTLHCFEVSLYGLTLHLIPLSHLI